MSNKKENFKRPNSASKDTTRRTALQPSKCVWNSNSNNTCNVTVSKIKPAFSKPNISILPCTSTVDYELQCDLAYSEYLQSLMFQQCVKNQIEQYEVALNDQQSIYKDVLTKASENFQNIEEEIKEYEMDTLISELLHKLTNIFTKNSYIFSTDVNNKLDKIIRTLEQACNNLYLNNVKVLETVEEYKQLLLSLNECESILKKILSLSGDTKKYKILCNVIERFRDVKNELVRVENCVVRSLNDTSKLTLEEISILFEAE